MDKLSLAKRADLIVWSLNGSDALSGETRKNSTQPTCVCSHFLLDICIVFSSKTRNKMTRYHVLLLEKSNSKIKFYDNKETIKIKVHPKKRIMSSFTHPQVFSNLIHFFVQ